MKYKKTSIFNSLFLLGMAFILGLILPILSLQRSQHSETEAMVERILREESSLLEGTLGSDFVPYLVALSKNNELDPLLVLAVMKVESSFNPSARSHAGAVGLLQVRPIVAKEIQRVWDLKGVDTKKLMNPFVNIHMGISYLSYLRTILGRDKIRMLSGYNVGPTKVKSAGIYSTAYSRKVLKIYAQFLKKYSQVS